MNYDALAKAIAEKQKVVIPVELLEGTCDYRRIFSSRIKKRIVPINHLTYNVISIVSLFF